MVDGQGRRWEVLRTQCPAVGILGSGRELTK